MPQQENRKIQPRSGLHAFGAVGFAAVGLLAACGGGEEDPPLPPDELYNRIEALSVLKTEEAKPDPQRLGEVKEGEVALGFRNGRACRLEYDGQLLLAAGSRAALARVDGQLRPLAMAGPVLPSGAYFRAPGVTISIGRRTPVAARAEAPGIAWPVGVTVGGAAKLPLQKFEGTWTCRGR